MDVQLVDCICGIELSSLKVAVRASVLVTHYIASFIKYNYRDRTKILLSDNCYSAKVTRRRNGISRGDFLF